ncbi:ferredoxin Fer [Haloarcula rubripromontorii]|uniref:ferredoxin Fer n=1 Tax=Haloarcula rubripromontorii TaxID=1705562 RepID=UPI00345B8564
MPMVEYLNYEVVDDRGWDVYDEENFELAAELDLPEEDYGFFDVPEGRYILEAAEAAGLDWPFSCRDGICSNCAAVVVDGDIEMDGAQALSDEEIEEKDVRLTCVGRPASDYIRLLYNAKHLDYLQDRIM